MSFFRKLFGKVDASLTRDKALEEVSALATIPAFICRLGYIVYGLQVVNFIVFTVFVLILGTVRGQFQFAQGDPGDILYQTLDGTLQIGWIQDGHLWVTQALSTVFFFLAFSSATDFFKNIAKTGKPFERVRARELKRVGAMLVLSFIIPDVAGMVSLWLTQPYFAGMSYGVSYLTQLVPLAVGIVVALFARIFEYGCILQEQDDALL